MKNILSPFLINMAHRLKLLNFNLLRTMLRQYIMEKSRLRAIKNYFCQE